MVGVLGFFWRPWHSPVLHLRPLSWSLCGRDATILGRALGEGQASPGSNVGESLSIHAAQPASVFWEVPQHIHHGRFMLIKEQQSMAVPPWTLADNQHGI